MTESHGSLPGTDGATTKAVAPFVVQGTIVLLFAVSASGDIAKVPVQPQGFESIPDYAAAAHLERLDGVEQRLLGDAYQQARRIHRDAVGRIRLPHTPGEPAHADVYRVIHKTGVMVWEVWLTAPAQPFDPQHWIDRLRLDTEESITTRIWGLLAPLSALPGADRIAPELYLPLCILSVPKHTMEAFIERHGADLIRLLHLDRTGEPFKAAFIERELEGDFCLRAEGMSLLSQRAALDLHAPVDVIDPDIPRSALPLLITLELLAAERTILRIFNTRLAQEPSQNIDQLLQLKREVLDGLEEYYGTLATGNGFSVEATARGEVLLGIEDLYNAVIDRLEMVTFSITTRYQRSTTRIAVWLSVIFGAVTTGSLAGLITTWYYKNDLAAVLGWTTGVTAATAVVIALLLYPRTR